MAKKLFRLPRVEPCSVLVQKFPNAFSHAGGMPVELRQRNEGKDTLGYAIARTDKNVVIEYGETSDLMRALGWLMIDPSLKAESSHPAMAFRGLMLDVSRNGVIRPDVLKDALIRLGLLGLNHFCLYTEDTYEVEGHPLIGYRRGKYSKAELRDLDEFASALGITMFPCIQTLGHMEHILKLRKYVRLQDTHRVISVTRPEARELVETLIREASAPYRSKLIHVGMDETQGIGRGRTFQADKVNDPRELYLSQVQFVAEVCRKCGLKPMMWGDIIIGMHEQAMSEDQRGRFPADMKVVYWDYYKDDRQSYQKSIQKYRDMGQEPLCSPGIWNWHRFWPCYRKTEAALPHFTSQAKEMGIQEMLVTMWGDDGQECPFHANWPGLSFFAEEVYERNSRVENAKRRMKAITGLDYDAIVHIGELEVMPGEETGYGSIGKCFLWEDPLSGRVSHHLGKRRLATRYRKLAAFIAGHARRAPSEFCDLLVYAQRLAEVLEQKVDLFNETRAAYLKKDKAALRRISRTVLPSLIRSVEKLWQARKRVWFAEFKPFGWEVLDTRFGGLVARLTTMKERLDAFLAGDTGALEELDDPPVQEFERLGPLILSHDSLSSLCRM